ncbi:RNA polymerase sigma factor [Streptomyces albus]|uniref:RNA polymerase sigma factor n=1 Tax=Streptomyces albus TaxID=1888 RepID=UPI00387A0A27
MNPVRCRAVRGIPTDRVADLFSRYQNRLTAYIRACLGRDYQLAEDLAQDTWTTICAQPETAPAGDEPHAFSWLAHVARQTISRHYLRTRTHHEHPAPAATPTRVSRTPSDMEVAA